MTSLETYLTNNLFYRISTNDKYLLLLLDKLKDCESYQCTLNDMDSIKLYQYQNNGVYIVIIYYMTTRGVDITINDTLKGTTSLNHTPFEKRTLGPVNLSKPYPDWNNLIHPDIVEQYYDWIIGLKK